jgi:class 3 adenylate cyclase
MGMHQAYQAVGDLPPSGDVVQSESDDKTFPVSTLLEGESGSLAGSQIFLGSSEQGSISTHNAPELNKVLAAVTPQGNGRVSLARLVVFLVLILGIIAQSSIQYVFSKEAEAAAFQESFEDQALILLTLWKARLDGLDEQVTSWPCFFDESFSASPIVMVVDDRCGNDTMSFELHGSIVKYLGLGDLHETGMTELGQSHAVANCTTRVDSLDASEIVFNIYPTSEMQDDYFTDQPTLNMVTSLSFGSVFFLFLVVYDCMVRKRHDTLTSDFLRSQEILSSLFPANVQERLFNTHMEASMNHFDLDLLHSPPVRQKPFVKTPATIQEVSEGSEEDFVDTSSSRPMMHFEDPMSTPKQDLFEDHKPAPSQRLLPSFLSPPLVSQSSVRALSFKSESSVRALSFKSEPIADLFPEVTVMFADIGGFTAWSSEREPTQVFKLLETIYHAFDKIAKKRKVFKVETIGDCYVAATGLPDPMEDHAVAMAKFANECMYKMNELTKKLELVLGPGTAELRMRFGLHSGPVTAGVLRGEKSRFQLFGDTVNFASRMESTGKKNRIQVSQATADFLCVAGVRHWLHPRDDLVNAKGKGKVQTYWVSLRSASGRSLRVSGSDHQLMTESSDSSIVELKSKRKMPLFRDASVSRSESLSSDNRERRNLLNESLHSHNRWSTGSQKNDSYHDDVDFDEELHESGRQERYAFIVFGLDMDTFLLVSRSLAFPPLKANRLEH